MAHISGSVDLVREREQERQARLQLRDEFRDPSPQPIFGQPVKVELEDETSRRIKDTLGDFHQVQHVLINDPKHLIGISRSGAVAAANNTAVTAASRSTFSVDHGGGGSSAWSSRNHATSNGLSKSGGNIPNGHHGVTKRPHQQVNGLHKPPPGSDSSSLRRSHPSANIKSGASIDKKQPQHGPSKHRSEHPPKINPISRGYSSSVGHLDQQPPQDIGTRASSQDRSSRSSYHPPTGAPVSSDKEHDHSTNHHRRTSSSGSAGNSSVINVNGEKPAVFQDGTVSSTTLPNGVLKHLRFQRIPDAAAAAKKMQLGSSGKHPPLPPKITIPTQEERSSEIEVETILREMKQAVPPPLTGIQTPKPESGFSFPTENREKDFSRVLEQLGHHTMPITPLPAPPDRIHPTSTKKSPHPCNSFNLQEDLEMSDSDDEGSMVPACKNPHVPEIDPYNKCPPQPPVNHNENSGLGVDRVGSCVQGNPQTPTKKATVVVPSGSPNCASGPVLSAQSSSSESSDSDSEDSGSESNDSDSSVSSEVSDQETTSAANKPAPQQWNLSNFFDETKRNHSPVFYGLDTNTNSNVSTVVKEDPPPASIQPADKDAFSLVDEDLVSGILEDHDIKEYLESPMDDLFSMEHGLVGMKSEALSPIPTSPVPAPLPLGPRGPRTPPSPPARNDSEEDEDDKPLKEKQSKCDSRKLSAPKIDSRSEIKSEVISKTSEHKSHRSRSEQFLNSRSKKKSSSRTKESSTNSDCNHKNDSQFHLDSVFSASNNSKDVSQSTFSEDMNKSGTVHPFITSSSCPVPSSATPTPKSTHTNPMKSHHKHSSPATTASSSFSSPKKKTSCEFKDGIKSGHHSSKSKSSTRSKSSLGQKETATSKSRNTLDKKSFPITDSGTKLSSRHDKSHDAKSKRNPSPTKAKHIVSTKLSRSHTSPCKSSTPKKSKTKSVKSSSSKSSSCHGEDKRKLEKKKKSSKFSIKNFLQSPFSSPVQESCQPLNVKFPLSPMRASESEDSPPPAVPKKSSESSLPLNKVQIEDENDEPSIDQGQSFIPKSKPSSHRKSSTSSSSRSRSRSNSRTRLSSTEKTKLKKRSSKSMKRRGSKSSMSDISSNTKKKNHRDTRQPKKTFPKSSVSSSSSASPHNSRHHSPVSSILCLDLPGHPPELLSPISASENNESAIAPPCSPSPLQNAVMVSIPFSKLLRIPEKHHHHHSSPPTLKPPKDRPEEVCPQWTSAASSPSQSEVAPPATLKSSSSERRSASSVAPCKKDIKTKPRTESSKSSKLGSDHKSVEKSSKSVLHSQSDALSHGKSSSVNAMVAGSRDKTSIKSGADTSFKLSKTGQDCSIVASKKRKIEESVSESSKKKSKVTISKSSPTAEVECKEKNVVVKTEKMDTSATLDRRPTPKRLERCDSASSLSSLCSQISHKSSKSQKERTKESLKDSQEIKKFKSILPPAKEIKREKEEKPKIVPKKETTSIIKTEKIKSKSKERSSLKVSSNAETKKPPEVSRNESPPSSSQVSYREDSCKIEETKPQPTNHQRLLLPGDQDPCSDWEHFAPEIQHELRGVPNHINKVNTPAPSEYYWQEGKKLKNMAEKEKNPIQQALKYFEATVMFILTSLHRELTNNKDPDSIYQIYRETLRFTCVIRSGIQKHLSHSTSGNIDFKILILCLKCQSLLHLKLYNLKIKEVKEQHKGVSDFMHSSSSKLSSHCSPMSSGSSYSTRNISQPSPCQPRIGGGGGPASVPSPHSPTPSPAGSVASVGSQSSGYSSSEVNGNHSRTHCSTLLQLPQSIPQLGSVSVPQNMFDVMAKHHSHLSNLHMCHELWEQADMYMTRSNSKDFFKDVADKSERLSLHSNIKELVNYLQKGLSLLKSSYC